jgi:hypothetical protein
VSLVTAPPVDRDALASLPAVRDVEIAGAETRFRTTDAGRTLAALTALLQAQHLEVVELQVRKATLEDVFLELTRRGRE